MVVVIRANVEIDSVGSSALYLCSNHIAAPAVIQ